MLYDFIKFRWSKDGGSLITWDTDVYLSTFLQHMREKRKDWKKIPYNKLLSIAIHSHRKDITSFAMECATKTLKQMHQDGRIEISTDEETGEVWVKPANNKYTDFSFWRFADKFFAYEDPDHLHWFDDESSFRMEISDKAWQWFRDHHNFEHFLCFPLYVLIRRMYEVFGEFDFNVQLAAKSAYIYNKDVINSLTDLNDAGIIDIEKSPNSKYCYTILNVKE